jgi:hypothetical protein
MSPQMVTPNEQHHKIEKKKNIGSKVQTHLDAIGRLNFIQSTVYIGRAFYYTSSLKSSSTLTKTN